MTQSGHSQTIDVGYGHLTATEAAALAAMSGVTLLVLTHISGRYHD